MPCGQNTCELDASTIKYVKYENKAPISYIPMIKDCVFLNSNWKNFRLVHGGNQLEQYIKSWFPDQHITGEFLQYECERSDKLSSFDKFIIGAYVGFMTKEHYEFIRLNTHLRYHINSKWKAGNVAKFYANAKDNIKQEIFLAMSNL